MFYLTFCRWNFFGSDCHHFPPCTRFRRLWCWDILGGRKRCRGWVSTEMHLNNLSPVLPHRSSKIVKSPGQKPALILRLMNACIRPITSALAKPQQACEAYVSLAMTDARKIVCWFFSFIPFGSKDSKSIHCRTATVWTTRLPLIRGLPWRSCLSVWHREYSELRVGPVWL